MSSKNMAALAYPSRFMRDIGKIYELPPRNTREEAEARRFISNLFTAELHRTASRQTIINELGKFLSTLPRIPSTGSHRADERLTIIAGLVSQANFSPKTILDLGAGTADITIALKRYYRLPTDRVFALDSKLPQVSEVTPIIYVDGKIPLPDKSIDLIVIFAVLHHIPPEVRPGILQEINRILSPNGMVIIREHDNDNDEEFYVYLDLVHILWYIAKQETEDPLYLLSKDETEHLFQQAKMIPSAYLPYPASIPNPKRIYHEVFKHPIQVHFVDERARQYLQTYVDRLQAGTPGLDAFPTIIRSHLTLQANWTQTIRAAVEMILKLVMIRLPVIDNVCYITVDALQSVIG